MAKSRTDGGWRYGELPDTAPLAMAYVPLQKSVSPAYESMEALSRGTLFPGLDLPFMGMVNKTQDVTPLTEMMALCFVAHELALYLDTHQDDAEAFAMYQSFLALKKEARERYVKQCGPVTHEDMLGMERYAWTMTGRGRADACLYMRRNCSIRCGSKTRIPLLRNS